MKLIKLVYLSHGWNLGLTGQPLIRENAEAWRYGPVIPSLYHDFKSFGTEPINRYALWPELQSGKTVFLAPKLTTASPTTLAILKKVWGTYKRYSAHDLSAMTHQRGTPWWITWYDGGGRDRLGTDIPDDLIRAHYQKLVSRA